MIHGAPSNDLAHHGIEPQALCVIDVLVAGKPPEYRLTQEADQTVQTIMTSAAVNQVLTREIMQAEYIVQFPKQQQAAVRADLRTMEFQANTAVETESVIAQFSCTRWVSHRHSPPMPSMHWSICNLRDRR